LVPVAVQPTGEESVFRIREGMTWKIKNTFSF